MRMNKKLKDICLNIIASGVMTAALQLIVYPLLGSRFSAATYGEILTIMGLCNILSGTLGNALNNVRLIRNSDYSSQKLVGDFNLLVAIASSSAFLLGFGASFFISGHPLSACLSGVATAFAVINGYYCVAFRLHLDYRRILICNLLKAIGYALGALMICVNAPWPAAFLTGELFGTVYTLKASGLISDGFGKTNLFRSTTRVYITLMAGTLISNIATYMDRLFLHPMMGSSAVSIYSVSAVVGKCISIVMIPISGVMLSYFSQDSYVMTRRRFYTQSLVMIGFAAVFTVLLIPVSPIVTRFLYPTIFDSARKYILIANTSAVIGVLGHMLAPAILKFVESYWQIVIATVYCLVYFLLGLTFIRWGGLWGFCWSALLANVSRCLVLLLLGLRIREKPKEAFT